MAAAGGPVEVAVVSAAEASPGTGGGSGGCCSVWEVGSGASVAGYRGGCCAARGLALLGGEHLLGAQLGKAFVGAWELQRKDQLQQKIICPGLVSCLTAAPNGLYILAGIAESIYLWEVSSGNLLAILNRHYQDLSCLAFTDDSSHFLSGAKDNLYCGIGGPMARVATASLDQTAKLWEISSGDLLLSVVFDVSIMSVTLDLAEYHMFCGGMDGSIFQVDLCSWSRTPDKLALGSRCPITNAFLTLAPANMLNPDSKPSIPLPKFSRHLHGMETSENPTNDGLTLCLGLHQKNLMGDQEQLKIQVTELEEEVRTLRKINKSLFDFSSRIITKPGK
ncbi:hypothetical protein JD844_034258 [Phrynosoma platyrhinos]|uniref:WD repeat-containing protein 18 n=1 Tax=Phrynosoma platyrhinos TaxID=52577 RepID=A0ABQ7T8M9_PHRPL|nr:hypothetical protein JD844_034258 [Phrynosoma platyrhinos]